MGFSSFHPYYRAFSENVIFLVFYPYIDNEKWWYCLVSIEQISISDIRLSRSILGCSIWSMLKKIYNSFNDDSMAVFATKHIIVSFVDVLHTLYHFKISHPCSKGKMTLFWRIPYYFWGWFWLVSSMGKMTKNGLNGGKREDYKNQRSQLSTLEACFKPK